MQQKIYFASDHAGYELKNELVVFVRQTLGYEAVDCGAHVFNADDDFTDFISKAAEAVSTDPLDSKAIILGGSGQGEAMLANRYPRVRAAVFYGGNKDILSLSRIHNDANVLSLGARFLSKEDALKAVELWLTTSHPAHEKYDRRIQKMDAYAVSSIEKKGIEKPSMSIVPSLPAKSFAEITALLDVLEGTATSVQIDIVDGVFAPHVSWPFTEPDAEAAFLKLNAYADFAIEMDCMCVNPEKYLDVFSSLNVERVIIHAGSTQNYDACISHAKEHGYKIGLGILNSTPHELIEELVPKMDFIQVMGIAEIGAQGQPFDEKTIGTVTWLRNTYLDLDISVDGSVNRDTLPRLLVAGANRFAPGSAIAQSQDPKASYEQLQALIVQ